MNGRLLGGYSGEPLLCLHLLAASETLFNVGHIVFVGRFGPEWAAFCSGVLKRDVLTGPRINRGECRQICELIREELEARYPDWCAVPGDTAEPCDCCTCSHCNCESCSEARILKSISRRTQ